MTIHPALAALRTALVDLRGYRPESPEELGHLILGLTGDGTGAPNLISEIGTLIATLIAPGTAVDQLRPVAAQYVREGLDYAASVAEDDATQYAAGALTLLDHPERIPPRGFHAEHRLPVEGSADGEPAALPVPTPLPIPVPEPQPRPMPAAAHA